MNTAAASTGLTAFIHSSIMGTGNDDSHPRIALAETIEPRVEGGWK